VQVIRGISAGQYDGASDAYDNLFKKAIAWSLSGVAEWDIAVKKVTAYSGSRRSQYIFKTLTALAGWRGSDGNEIQVVASVRVTDSAFSYAQLAYMLQVAVAGGDFDTQLHNYAAYLHLNTATDATAASVSTGQQRSEDSGDTHHRSRGSVPGLSVTAIVLIVLFTVGAGAVWYYYEYATFKRTCLLCGPANYFQFLIGAFISSRRPH
jgi:hypothetical protein